MQRRLLLSAIVFYLACEAYAQPATRITLHLPRTTLERFIDTIQKMGRFKFNYPENVNLYREISIWVDSATFRETAQLALKDLSITAGFFTFEGNEVAVLTPIPVLDLKGRVLDDRGQSVDDAEVHVKNAQVFTATDRHGFFRINHLPDSAILEVSGPNIVPLEQGAWGRKTFVIIVKRRFNSLPGFTLAYNDGYQRIKAVSATGSYSMEDQADLDRVVGRNLADHLNGQLSGLTPGSPGNSLGFGIRGHNTLLSSGTPLLVWDNFAYAGRTDDVNIYDLQSITALKDAVAAGVWGAYSGNGVIVFTSREGRYNQKPSITLTMNTTITEKPNLFYQPRMSSSSYIAADSILVRHDYYNDHIHDPVFAINPAVDVLWKEQNGLLTAADANTQLLGMAHHNILSDLSRYYYRAAVNQQVHLSTEGGGADSKYYLSIGYDRDPTALVRNRYQRVTLHEAYTVRPGSSNLEISLSGNLAVVNTRDNNEGNVPVAYPFASLAGPSGQPLPVSYMYNPAFVDTAQNSYPLDWHYRPLQELALADIRRGRVDGHLQALVKYQLRKDLSAEALGRWMKGHSYLSNLYNKSGFFVRNLVNTYSQGPAGGFSPIPDSDILMTADTNYTAYNLRGQLHFHPATKGGNQWNLFAGAEIDDAGAAGETRLIYGHNNAVGNTPMDPQHLYPTRPDGGEAKIPTDDEFLNLINRSISVYSNVSYNWHQSYTFYSAFRMDASNVAGVPNSERWGPFWSVGASHNLLTGSDRDSTKRWGPLLKVRASFGCNGNTSNRTAYLVTQPLVDNAYNVRQIGILSPPDPSLGWEKTYIFNAGLDFAFFRDSASRHGRIFGSLDLYQRWSVNLLSNDSLTPSAGVTFYQGNTAAITGNGIDLSLTSINTLQKLKWTSTLVFSVSRDWISRYRFQPVSPSGYVSGEYLQRGKPSTALFSYQWAGLDPLDGSPRGYFRGQVSKDYPSLMSGPGAGLSYNGSWQPVVFGSVLNTFCLGRFSLSARVLFKTGYYFRRPSIDYNALGMGISPGHRDYDRRWQAPGDEQWTSVPSFPVTMDPNRDLFYLNSSALVTRADQLRWQDCSFSYEWTPGMSAFAKKKAAPLPFKKAVFYIYVNNIGLLWKANRYGIDPDAAGDGDLPAARAYSMGARITF